MGVLIKKPLLLESGILGVSRGLDEKNNIIIGLFVSEAKGFF